MRMLKGFFVFLFLHSLLSFSLGQLPTIPIDFEPSTINYTINQFGGVLNNGLISNPDATGENTSSQVLSLTKNQGAEVWGGVAMPLDLPIDFGNNSTTLEMKVWSPRINVPILLKLEDTTSPPNGDGNPSVFAEVQFNTSIQNNWEVLSFDMTTHGAFDANNNYNQIVIFPDFGSNGVTGGETFYFDDIVHYEDMTPIDTGCLDTIRLQAYIHAIDSTVHAEHVLKSSAMVSSPLDIVYFAGSYICLDPGFMVDLGSDFEASIQECCDEVLWYEDTDGDGFGNPYHTITSCTQPAGYVETPINNTGYTTPESYSGYSLVWSDEFENSALNLNNWTYDLGNGCPNVCNWGNNEEIWYQTQNAIVNDDFLTIEARQEAAPQNYQYTSSRIKTQGLQSFQYGRVDIRAKMPYGKGIWPALWMLGDNITTVGWPSCGEIDIMEMIGGTNNDNTVHGTAHWNNNGHNYQGGSYTLNSGILADQFHVYSIIWDSNQIRWLIDDFQYFSLDITDSTRTEFHENFFFIFNIAVGGNWPGSPDGSTVFPQTMMVDYIRVFQ